METEETTKGEGTHSIKRAIIAVVFFYAFLLLLNGKGIREEISKQEYGPKRDFLMKVTWPLEAVSVATRACWIRDSVEHTAGNWLNEDK